MNKIKTLLLLAAPSIALTVTSCSNMTSSNYTSSQFVGTWKYEHEGMYFIPSSTNKVVNRLDGTSTTTVMAVGKAPKPNPKFESKIKPGQKLMDTKWRVSGSNFITTSESGKNFTYKIISVSPDKYTLRNGMGTYKVYDRMK